MVRVVGLRRDLVVVEVDRRVRRMAWVQIAAAEIVSPSNAEIDGSVWVDAPTLIVCGFGMRGL